MPTSDKALEDIICPAPQYDTTILGFAVNYTFVGIWIDNISLLIEYDLLHPIIPFLIFHATGQVPAI